MGKGKRGVVLRSGNGFANITTEIRLDSRAREREEQAKQKRRRLYGEMSFEEREDLLRLYGSGGHNEADWEDVEDDADALLQLPPGEEGILESHAGGEEELCKTLFELPASKRRDLRQRRERRQLQNQEWKLQLPHLITAYLAWQNGDEAPMPQMPGEGVQNWSILVVNTYDQCARSFTSGPNDNANTILMRHGYIGSAPNPTVAFHAKLLRFFHELHVICPRLSLQAQVKALCRLHRVSYKPYLVTQFSQAYDVFLAIRRGVDAQVAAALGRDSKHWRMKNVCAPCLYTLEDEKALHPAMLVAIDGNQSLKLVDDMFHFGESLPDDRDGRSDMWLSAEDVDRFKDEVQNARQASLRRTRVATSSTGTADAVPESQSHAGPSSSESTPDRAVDPPSLDPADDDIPWADLEDDGDVKVAIEECVKRWKAAGPEARKKMFTLFAATGVFICVCRHGHVLVICDMIRSGELMKYPLAIIHRLMEVYGIDFRYGYDIACAFHKILMRSSLGPRVETLGVTGVVPAFHGHAHNRRCQVSWHPLYMPGCGKEDFEGCERVFSQSNALAATTRFASAFHRHQAIDEYFKHWDHEKHAEEASFLVNNYKQALAIIKRDSAQLAALRVKQPMPDEELERCLRLETEYIDALTAESDEVTKVAEYMEALRRAEALSEESRLAAHEFNNLDFYITQKGYQAKEIRAVNRRYTTSFAKYMEATENVRRIEHIQDIVKPWEHGTPEYTRGMTILVERRYRQTVDRLEHLLVQRLLELTKLGMSGTGYKQREKITKALKARGAAIQKALKEYNERAAALPVPRPTLSWSDVVEMATIAQFDILRDARQDLRALEWAQPLRREAMGLYFNIKRAREEIDRLDVEASRLLTFMVDEHVDYYRAIQDADPALAAELTLQWKGRRAVHSDMAARLHSLKGLAGYNGILRTGVRVGRDPNLQKGVPLPPWIVPATGTPSGDGSDPDESEEVLMQLVDGGEASEDNMMLEYMYSVS